jgi:regulator of CtrA degradation
MNAPVSINARIVEGLYCEALVLSDEVRDAFDMSRQAANSNNGDDDLARVALSCEALRTTTRMMHALAWLLNQRAYLSGEISEFQLRRHGRLAGESAAAADPDRGSMLHPALCELVDATERFYARLQRLDTSWHKNRTMQGTGAIARLRSRLNVAVNH